MGARRFGNFGLVGLGLAGGVLLSLGISAVAQRNQPLPLQELQQFANVFSAIKSSYIEPMSDKMLINDAIKGMFSDLDPHSAYLDPDAFKEMEQITQGGFGGLGIEIGSEDGMPKVIAPIEDTPAARAGILAGDLITEINGKPTKGMTLNDAIKLMRGEPKTSIELTIKREGKDKPLKFTIVRDLIKVRSVRSKMLPDNIAFVRISQFQETTVADLVKQLRALGEKGAPRGLVLDLRNDPGGLLDSAIGVSSAFIKPNDLVVSTKGRVPSSNHQYFAKSADGVSSLPAWTKKVRMVVLANIGSASASEIVAGALQDHKRAKIIGNRTFGKGSVQSVLPLSEDTGIKLTTARYYTPSGRSIQVTGVEPDITVDDTPQGNLFRLPREVDLKHHLLNSAVSNESADEEKAADKSKVEPKMFEFGGTDDFQLRQAVHYLEGRKVNNIEPGLVLTASKKPGASVDSVKPVEKTGTAGKPAAAEKKTEVKPKGGVRAPAARPPKPSAQKIERFRITPNGVIEVH
jgi:carboxyl-terminal processing protease